MHSFKPEIVVDANRMVSQVILRRDDGAAIRVLPVWNRMWRTEDAFTVLTNLSKILTNAVDEEERKRELDEFDDIHRDWY